MRLLTQDSQGQLTVAGTFDQDIPPYAILSHTWGKDPDEATLEDILNGDYKNKTALTKLQFCACQARHDGLDHFWIDTCCIDKTNHAELSESITSMFRWYQEAAKCYVYLSDVSAHKRDHNGSTSWHAAFKTSRWLSRGWTLQELLAPKDVQFFSREGELLGDKHSLADLIQGVTGIATPALLRGDLSTFSVEERLRWASERQTRKFEDRVYSLLGIFDISMPIIYGEREKSFARFKDALSHAYRNRLDNLESILYKPSARDYGLESAEVLPNDHRQVLLDHLGFEQMDSRRSTIKTAHSSTCAWLLDHPAYVTWADFTKVPQHHGFLWINGKPGAGKSTLMKFALAHASKQRSGCDVIVSFFFNARGEELEKSTVGMFRSILFQLLTQIPDLYGALAGLYPMSAYQSQSPSWTMEVLTKLLTATLAKLGNRRVVCFVDALDECDEQQVAEMVEYFENLGEAAQQDSAQFSICFASRHYPAIHIKYGECLTLEHETGHRDDLEKFIRSRLQRGKRGKLIDDVRNQVVEKANGVFIWAVLVVDILNKEFLHGAVYAVQKRLDEIPAELSDLFRSILRRDCENMDRLQLCLQWILFAARPLRREEFFYALTAGLDPGPQNITKWDPEEITTEYMDRLVLSTSKGLAELTKSKTPTVQFIHESVRDFLIKENGLRQLWHEADFDVESQSHEQIKLCCSNYLQIDISGFVSFDKPLPKASSNEGKSLRREMLIKFPLLDYAGQFILYHANEAAEGISQVEFMESLDSARLKTVMNVFEWAEVRRHDIKGGLHYFLAEKNFARLIRATSPWNLDEEPPVGRFRNALFAALAHGHHAAVKALLQQSSQHPYSYCITGQDSRYPASYLIKNIESSKGLPRPLIWAIKKGYRSLAINLISVTDVALNVTDDVGEDALELAVEKGYDDVVTLLLVKGFDSDDSVHEKALAKGRNLVRAVTNGKLSTVRLLLDHDANTDALYEGDVALHKAVRQNNMAMTQLLLSRGSKTEVRNANGMTALHVAVNVDAPAPVILMLLEHGADTEAVCVGGHTALTLAITTGKDSASTILLNEGADVECRNDAGRTPLMMAASRKKCLTVEHLLEKGANIEAVDQHGMTALMYASMYGSLHSMQLLISKGAQIEKSNNTGRTALSYAICHLEPLRLLLSNQANIEHTDNDGITSLMWAVRLRKTDAVQILITHGALLEAVDKDGRTALSWAIQYEAIAEMDILVKNGANNPAQKEVGWWPSSHTLSPDDGDTDLEVAS